MYVYKMCVCVRACVCVCVCVCVVNILYIYMYTMEIPSIKAVLQYLSVSIGLVDQFLFA